MKNTQVIKSAQELMTTIKSYKKQNPHDTVGFVPTMGALHSGHTSLMQKSSEENNLNVLSIFVNPTQFNNPTDLDKYPKTFEADLALAQKHDIDILYFPDFKEMYPDEYRFKVTESEFSKKLCGAHRPGHFDGVLTIVLKLLQIVKPHKAYFGLKDYQQYQLIKDMTEAFFLDIDIIGCPTMREESGLAMSSRNTRLSTEGLKKASLIYKTITQKISKAQASEILTQAGFEIDYLEDIENRRYVAATLENVRLIDNVEI
ncbi:MAG: pantoate--beta-alanine ligase [Pseudobdellovibrio sp.]